MKSYQVVEFGKPLELREYENPQPQGEEVLVKLQLVVYVIVIFIWQMAILISVMGKE